MTVLEYCKHFDSCHAVNDCTDEEVGHLLASSLRGHVMRLLREQNRRLSFNRMKQMLANRFSDYKQAENHLMELK